MKQAEKKKVHCVAHPVWSLRIEYPSLHTPSSGPGLCVTRDPDMTRRSKLFDWPARVLFFCRRVFRLRPPPSPIPRLPIQERRWAGASFAPPWCGHGPVLGSVPVHQLVDCDGSSCSSALRLQNEKQPPMDHSPRFSGRLVLVCSAPFSFYRGFPDNV